MATPTNDEILGKPIEAVTRVPVKDASSAASSRALVAGAEQLAQLGLQADQALQGARLRRDINTTLQSFENVQSYVAGDTEDLFTGDERVDAETRAMIGEMDDIREAVRQGVMLPEMAKARLEVVLKNAKSRRPNYAPQLNEIAGEVLGFNVQGWASRKLFEADQTAKASPMQKAREKVYEDAVMTLYGRGFGPEVFDLPADRAVKLASTVKGATAAQQDALTSINLERAEGEQFDRLLNKTALAWTGGAVDSQLIKWQVALNQAPVDPEERAQWNLENLPRAVADLRTLRAGLRTGFLADLEATHGPEAVARMSESSINAALEPAYARIDQMIEDIQDPVLQRTYQDSIELGNTGILNQFMTQSPNARKYLALFSKEGRDKALLEGSVGGVVSKQFVGSQVEREFDRFFGFNQPGASEEDRRTSDAAQKAYTAIVGADTVEGAAEEFRKFTENSRLPWFTVDTESANGRVKAANNFALRALGNIDNIQQGLIEPGREAEALERTRTTLNAMLDLPVRQSVIELPATSAMMQKLVSPETYAMEKQYGVSFQAEREKLYNLLQLNVSDMRSFYTDTLRQNSVELPVGFGEQTTTLRPLQYTSFLFTSDSAKVTAVPDRQAIRERVATAGSGVTAGSVSGQRIASGLLSASETFNADSGYRDGVAGLFFSEYNEIKAEEGSVDVKDPQVAQRLAGTGILENLGLVDPDLSYDIVNYLRAVRQDPNRTPPQGAPLAWRLAYEWNRTPSMSGAQGSVEEQARALANRFKAGLLIQYAEQGKLRFK